MLIKILWRLKFFTFGTLLWDITVFKLGTTFEVKQSGTENFYTFGSLSYLSICIFVKNQNPYFSSHMLPIGGLRDGLWMQSLATHAFNYQLIAFYCELIAYQLKTRQQYSRHSRCSRRSHCFHRSHSLVWSGESGRQRVA